MKILISPASMHFSDTFPAGETQIAYGYAVNLARRGHRVTVFSPRVSLERHVAGLEAVELAPGYAGRVSNGGYAADKLGWWEFSVRARSEARRRARSGDIDIIHHLMPAHHGKFSLLTDLGLPLVYGPMLIPWESAEGRTRVVPEGEHVELLKAKFADRMDMHIGMRLFNRTLSRADVIMVSVEKLVRRIDHDMAGKAVHLAYGVDTGLFHPNGDQKDDRPTILFLGLVEERKGIFDLLQAVSILGRRTEVRLSIVGGGELEKVRKAADELGIAERVTVHGPVPHTEVADHFRTCSVFCLPSHGEPFGMVLLQAMAAGKPIVATRTGGVDEILADGTSGILVDQRQPGALARALDRVLSDEALRKSMGASNRRQAVDRYDWSVVTGELEQIYERARREREGRP